MPCLRSDRLPSADVATFSDNELMPWCQGAAVVTNPGKTKDRTINNADRTNDVTRDEREHYLSATAAAAVFIDLGPALPHGQPVVGPSGFGRS
ncbi:unnamed protein product [Heligmosomoides polygyrus]|uniref:Transposase n=1 Tax=Heligmosomoides polygyrus TaxID=6339 RepID=A0A183G185_HELPZ|nr:unnamed protein product [Heligmosomoides polygyrus]